MWFEWLFCRNESSIYGDIMDESDYKPILMPMKRRWRAPLFTLLISLVFICILTYLYTASSRAQIHININKPVCTVDEKFLSFAIDTSFMKKRASEMTSADWKKITELAKVMNPGYMRLGGTAADKLYFNESLDHEDENIYMSIEIWKRFNEFVEDARLNLLFDLNVLIRNENDEWNPENAKALLNVSKFYNFHLDFQLGNEPNSFLHVFNRTVSPIKLSKDFEKLKNILKSDSFFHHSKIVGPDVTNPRLKETPSIPYLKTFLKSIPSNTMNAVTWHQYNVNGRNATVNDFLNPNIMNELKSEIDHISSVVIENSNISKIWLGETGSAYGGGAYNLSDKYVSIFFFLDKLGVSARKGIDVVIRQTFFGGNYALIDSNFNPNPDFWIALLYKQLVGSNVFETFFIHGSDPNLRFYCHSAKLTVNCLAANKRPTNVVFGLNLANKTSEIQFGKFYKKEICQTYTFTPNNNLQSNEIMLNNQLLYWKDVKHDVDKFYQKYSSQNDIKFLPPFSIVFWVF